MTSEPGTGLIVDIEPFDPARHDRTAFSCGSGRIDNYLERTARKHQKDGFARVFVAVLPGETGILGYHAINAHAVEAEALPAAFSRRTPGHGYVPAAYLSIVGVDLSVQGRGLGRALIVDAFNRLLSLSEEIGLAVVVLGVLEEGGAEAIAHRTRFHERLGFQSLQSRPMRMYFSIKNIRAVFQD